MPTIGRTGEGAQEVRDVAIAMPLGFVLLFAVRCMRGEAVELPS